MLTIKAAREIVREHTPAPWVKEHRLIEARGLYLAEQVRAPEQLPRVDNSAMDGYAVVLPGNASVDKPIKLEIIGESRAGMPWKEALATGTAVQISTGAPNPELRTLAGRFGQPVEDLDSGRAKLLLVSIANYHHHTAQLQPGGPQQSHMLSTVTNSDGFIIVPSEKTAIAENETFPVNLFPWAEIRGTLSQSKRIGNG